MSQLAPRPHRPAPIPRTLSVLVGRERETSTLEAVLEDLVTQGRGGLVLITGEAGIGKTRLAAELRSHALARGCQWLEGRHEREGSFPLQPYVEAVRAYLETAPEGSLARLLGPYAPAITKSFPTIAADLDAPQLAPELAWNDPEMSRQQHLEATCHLFFGIASQAPLVLFLDDLQWAPSMDILQALAQRDSSHPLLLVGAYRDAELRDKPILSRSVLAMNRYRLFLSLHLHRLGRDQVSQMVPQGLDRPASEHLVDLLYDRTEGNPFFVEELVGYLVESGALTLEGEVWDIPETISLQMPDSVRVVVEERLERLDSETRKTLAMASVIGQEFTMPILQEVTGVDEDVLVDTVDRAVEARVLVPGPSVGQEAYAFADNQVREVLYQDTGIARRRRYHLRVGEAIEKVQGLRPEEHYDALAHHFLEGNDLEKAVDYSIKAGDLAWRRSVFPRARGHYQVAAELLEELGEESERAAHVQAQFGIILVSLSAIGVSSEGAPRGVRHINRALDTFVKVGNVRRAAALHSILGTTYLADAGVEQDYHEAGRHAQAAVDLLAGEEDSLDKAMACSRLAFWYERDLDLDRAEELAREALRIAEAVQDPDAVTWACTTLGLVLVQRGHLDQGLSYAERGLAAAQKARTPWFRERAAANPIHMYPWLADVGCYEEWFTRWEDLQRTATALRHEAQVLGVMAAVSFQVGNPERGQSFLAKIAQVAPDASFEWHGVVLAMLGDREAAERDFASLDWTGKMGFRPSAIRSARHYGQLLLDQGKPQQAEEMLGPQWEYCRERGAVTLELNLLPPLCESYLRLERMNEAHACLERAGKSWLCPRIGGAWRRALPWPRRWLRRPRSVGRRR